jgi:hypothetical protein
MAGFPGGFGGVNRPMKHALVNARASHMVAMVMRKNDGVEIVDVASVFGEAIFYVLGRDACIKEQPQAARLDVEAVSIASGLQRNHFHDWIIIWTLSKVPFRFRAIQEKPLKNGRSFRYGVRKPFRFDPG